MDRLTDGDRRKKGLIDRHRQDKREQRKQETEEETNRLMDRLTDGDKKND